MLHFKTAREQKSLYIFGTGLLATGAITLGSILFYAFVSRDQHASVDASLSTMNLGVFCSLTLMIVGTIIRGVRMK